MRRSICLKKVILKRMKKLKLGMYEIYIARAAEIFGVPKSREIYEQAIEAGLPDKDVKTMCLRYAELEKRLGEIDRARGICIYASQLADPRVDNDFWTKFHEFEVQHGNEDTFREMLRIKRSVSASYEQTHVIAPEYLMAKDQKLDIDEAKDKLRQAGVHEDEMAALERQLTTAAPIKQFVRASEPQQEGVQVTANDEEIKLPEESDSEEDEKVEIAQKDVPSAVFGGLLGKRDSEEDKDKSGVCGDTHLGALDRIKRLKATVDKYISAEK